MLGDMWQVSALASLFSTALTDVADKAAVLYAHRVDSFVATFYRQFLFLFLTCLVGYVGWAGELQIIFNWQILLYATASLPSAYFYTLLLRKVEITGIEAAGCLSPLLFLVIDMTILQIDLSFSQVFAIIVLTLGGLMFALDGKTKKLKKELTWLVGGIFVYSFIHDVISFYTFKNLNDTIGVNGVSFYTSGYLWVTIGSLLLVLLMGRGHHLLRPVSLHYMSLASIGKSFDVVSGLLWFHALSLAAVSQVTALGAIQPIIVLVVASVTQRKTSIHIRERLDSRNLRLKVLGVTLLALGGLMIS